MLTSAIASCDVNDVKPDNAMDESIAFDTPARIELAMAGVYDAAQSGYYDPLNGGALQVRGYPFGAASIEQGDFRGEDLVSNAAFFDVTYNTAYNASTANNVNMWSNLYAVINGANLVIEGVRTAKSKGVITEQVANQYEGEARFLRALSYHELLVNFSKPYSDDPTAPNGGVPFRDFAVNSPETIEKALKIGRGTVAENYTKILEDLDYAETNLPATRASQMRVTRATKGAAIALKTRIKLHKNDFAGVIAEANKIVDGSFQSSIGGYQLTATPEGPFANNISSEAVFSIENNAADNPNTNGSLARMLSGNTGGRQIGFINPNLYNASFWLDTDLRRTQLLTLADGKYFTNKYRDVTNQTDYAPIIRYAEVLLNAAEAEARVNGVTFKAVGLLNAVRNRAVGAANAYQTSNFASAKDLIRAILNERRIEFFAEGRRWPDIHRLVLDPDFGTNGIPAKVSRTKVTKDSFSLTARPTVAPTLAKVAYTEGKFLWPIPAIETSVNPLLAQQQNPGY